MNKVIKNIIKYCANDDFYEPIKPAKSFVPQWYKDIENFNYSNIKFFDDGYVKRNVKNCMPFLDSLTSGYIVELPCDIYVEKRDHGPFISWESPFAPVDSRRPDTNLIPIPHGCADAHFIWRLPYSLSFPKATSIFVSHPFNRFDLPFVSLSGIVDGGTIMNSGNFPFFISKDFEGLIKKGTPILQIVPFKPESWKIEEDKKLLHESENLTKKKNQTFFGYYKNNIWNRKRYE